MPIKDKALKDKTPKRLFTLGEEITHSVTHGIGTGLSIAGLVLLLVRAAMHGDVYHIVSFSIYGVSLIILYLASTLYHGIQHPRVKRVFQIIDHASVYLLIAGSYTPFLMVALRDSWGWTFLVIIWGLALLGISFETLFIERFEILSTVAYVLMGWLSVVLLKELAANIPIGGMIWLAVGGVAYTVGVIFYALRKIPYMHVIWHVFVLGGSICHFFAVFLYLAPA